MLRECLQAPDVEAVLAIGRTGTGQAHAKLRELVHRRAMLRVARDGAPRPILANRDINELAA